MRKILCGAIIAVLVLFGSDTRAAVYKIPPSGDTWVYNVTPDAILGNDRGLATDLQNYSPQGFVFLKFNIPAFPNESIQSATLYLYQYDGAGYGEGPTALVLIGDDNWSESTRTWNNAPNGPNYLFPLLSASSDGRSHRGWSSWRFPWDFNYGHTITLRLGENSSGDQVHVYYSSEYYGAFPGIESGLEPYLEIITAPHPYGVAAGLFHTLGNKSDNMVVAVGHNEYSQLNTGSWRDIVQVAGGEVHTVGLKSDGTVVAVGNNKHGQVNVGSWRGIVQVAAGGAHTVGLKSDGTVVAAGNNSYNQLDVNFWSGIVQVAAGYYHTVGLKSDGTVVAAGGNDHGQLNVGSWSGIVQVAAGAAHTVGVKSDGTVVAAGLNEDGQGNVGDWNLLVGFTDVPPDYWAYDYIIAIYGAQITTGCSTDTREYCPGASVSREQMAVFLIRALNRVPEDGYCGSTPPFSDVAADRWSCKYIKKLVELGITSGIGQGLFGPEDPVTREQMAVFLTRAVDEVPNDGYCGTVDPFTDVPYSLWSCKYVKKLVELGITLGVGDGLYGPGNPVTRDQMAVFLARAFLGM